MGGISSDADILCLHGRTTTSLYSPRFRSSSENCAGPDGCGLTRKPSVNPGRCAGKYLMVTRRNLPDKAHFLQEIRDQYTQGENKASKCEPFGSPLSRVCLTEALADVSVGCVHLAQYSYSPFTTKCRFVQVAKSHFTAGVLSMAAKH